MSRRKKRLSLSGRRAVYTRKAQLKNQKEHHGIIDDIIAKIKDNHGAVLILLSTALLFLATFKVWDISTIYVMDDEFGYWSNAAAFLGFDWKSTMYRMSFYSFGYSLFIVPIMAIVDDPANMYRIACILNALFLTCSFLVNAKSLERICPDISKSLLYFFVFIASTYSAYMLHSRLAWSEMCVLFFFSLTCNLFLHFSYKASVCKGLALGIASGFLYMTHQRTLGVMAAVFIMVIVMIANRKVHLLHGVAVIVACALCLILQEILKGYIDEYVQNADRFVKGNDFSSVGGVLSGLISLQGIWATFKAFCGQIFYLTASTYIIFLFGVGTIFKEVFAKLKYIKSKDVCLDERLLLYMFILLASIFTVGIGAIYAKYPVRMDHTMYGRYNEMLLLFFVSIGLVGIWRDFKPKQLLIYLACYITVAFITKLNVVGNDSLSGFNMVTTVGLWPFATNSFHFRDAILVSIIPCGMIMLGYCLKKCGKYIITMAYVVVCAGFFFVGFSAVNNSVIPAEKNTIYPSTQIVKAFVDNERLPLYYIVDKGDSSGHVRRGPLQLSVYRTPVVYRSTEDAEYIEGNNIVVRKAKSEPIFSRMAASTLAAQTSWYDVYLHDESGERGSIVIPVSTMNSQIRENDSDLLLSKGAEGFLAYGPYITMAAGEYMCEFDLSFFDSFQEEAGYVDIYVNDKDYTIAKKTLTADMFSIDSRQIVEIPFVLTDQTYNVEFRIYSAKGTELEAYATVVRKKF